MSYQQFWTTQRALQERAKQAAMSLNYAERGRLNVAVVGTGIGELHVDAFTALVQRNKVICICDLDLPKARTLADRYGVSHVTADYNEFFQGDVDVVHEVDLDASQWAFELLAMASRYSPRQLSVGRKFPYIART